MVREVLKFEKMVLTVRKFWSVVLVIWTLSMISLSRVMSLCSSDRLLLYQVTMQTYWSKIDFPKDYPKFRPPAQWSKLVGRTHNSEFSLYRIGSYASSGLKKFAESGNSDIIDTFSQGTTGVCDAFTAPPILEGVGQTETQFFADGNHSKVSLLSRIVPSPDWFVGVDSVDLCLSNQGEWVQSLIMEVDGIDAGSDNGYTFTAPKWPSVPQEAIYQITASHPSHPAASFFYPNRTRHRPIATFTFTKLKEYSLWPQAFDDMLNNTPLTDEIEHNDIGNEPIESEGDDDEHYYPNKLIIKRKRSRKVKGRVDCVMSKWTEWSDCTSKTCDLSEQYRTRSILSHPRGTGTLCSALIEKKICISDKSCQSNLFDW